MSNFSGRHAQPIFPLPAAYPYQYSGDYYALIDGVLIYDDVVSSPPPSPYYVPPATNSSLPALLDESLILDEIHVFRFSRPAVGADQRRGLSEETIRKRLKTARVNMSANDDADVVGEETCVICQAEYGGDAIVVGILDCGHRYHPECIKEWLLRQNCCPICKRKAISS